MTDIDKSRENKQTQMSCEEVADFERIRFFSSHRKEYERAEKPIAP